MYSELTNVDDYRNLVDKHQETIGKKDSQFDTNKHSPRQDTTKFVVIERIKPMTRLNTPSKFRCYLVDKQGSINQKSNKKPSNYTNNASNSELRPGTSGEVSYQHVSTSYNV